MAYAPISQIDARLVRGTFREAEFGKDFEYSAAAAGEYLPFPGYDLKVWVGGGAGGDQGFRWAKVVATRAYLVTDEDADGQPVIDRWVIRGHRQYAVA